MDLVVRDVPVRVRIPAAVPGHDRLVQTVRLIALAVGDLGAMASVEDYYDVVRLRLLYQPVESGEDTLPCCLLVAKLRDLPETEALLQQAPDQRHIIQAAGEGAAREERILIDADQERPPAG